MNRALSILAVGFLSSILASPFSYAADAVATRDQAVSEYHVRFDQQFSEIHARLLDAQSKAAGIKSILELIAVELKDYDAEIVLLTHTLQDPNAPVETAVGYAIEEIGELQWNVSTIETKLTKIKTIKCAKGRLTKSVTEVAPKCPAGYKIKK